MFVSIIIPVYNAEKYLVECLDSVLRQTITDFELICVNDGSTDNSASILDEYKMKDKRLVVIHKANGGVSSARNAGLEVAQGEYVGFVDADDTIKSDFYEKLLTDIQEDLVSGFLGTTNLPMIELVTLSKPIVATQVIPLMLRQDTFNSVCVKVFHNHIIKKYNVVFPVGVELGEDAHFILNFLKYAKTLRIINANLGYCYRDNLESATKQFVKDDRYIRRMFLEYDFDHQSKFDISLDEEVVTRLKAMRLMDTFVATLSLYFRTSPYLSEKERLEIIKKGIVFLQELNIFPYLDQTYYNTKNRFELFVINTIKNNNFTKLKWAFKYVHWRNGIK